MSFNRLCSTDIKKEIIKIIIQNNKSSHFYKVAKSLFNYINNYNLAVFGSIIHKMLTKSTYDIDNIDILINHRHKEKIRMGELPSDIYIKNIDKINFSKHIIGHDIIAIGKTKINFIYIDIRPSIFIAKEVPYYFLKNFYYKKHLYFMKNDFMKEMRIFGDTRDKIINKYKKRGVVFKFMFLKYYPE